MVSLLSQLEARRAEIVQRMSELQAHLEAVDSLITLEHGRGKAASVGMAPVLSGKRGRSRGIDPKGLNGQILAAIDKEPSKGWTNGELVTYLRERDVQDGEYKLPIDDSARSAISAALGYLWRTGRIRQVSAPRGQSPGIYRAIEKEAAEATP